MLLTTFSAPLFAATLSVDCTIGGVTGAAPTPYPPFTAPHLFAVL